MTTTTSAAGEDAFLNAKALGDAGKLQILDDTGEKVPFGSIINDAETTVVVFIRHFFCGNCQAYVAELAKVKPEALQGANAKLVVIGCGDWQPINMFKENAGYAGAVYADPSRELFHALGMTTENLNRTPKGEPRPSYLTRGIVASALSSIWKGPLQNPGLMGKQGPIAQLGGEFVFKRGNECVFASRMRHTEDHVSVADLMHNAGVE